MSSINANPNVPIATRRTNVKFWEALVAAALRVDGCRMTTKMEATANRLTQPQHPPRLPQVNACLTPRLMRALREVRMLTASRHATLWAQLVVTVRFVTILTKAMAQWRVVLAMRRQLRGHVNQVQLLMLVSPRAKGIARTQQVANNWDRKVVVGLHAHGKTIIVSRLRQQRN